MLEVTFARNDRNRCCGISARGHADFAVHGKDVVCAAVSAILQAARLGLTELRAGRGGRTPRAGRAGASVA